MLSMRSVPGQENSWLTGPASDKKQKAAEAESEGSFQESTVKKVSAGRTACLFNMGNAVGVSALWGLKKLGDMAVYALPSVVPTEQKMTENEWITGFIEYICDNIKMTSIADFIDMCQTNPIQEGLATPTGVAIDSSWEGKAHIDITQTATYLVAIGVALVAGVAGLNILYRHYLDYALQPQPNPEPPAIEPGGIACTVDEIDTRTDINDSHLSLTQVLIELPAVLPVETPARSRSLRVLGEELMRTESTDGYENLPFEDLLVRIMLVRVSSLSEDESKLLKGKLSYSYQKSVSDIWNRGMKCLMELTALENLEKEEERNMSQEGKNKIRENIEAKKRMAKLYFSNIIKKDELFARIKMRVLLVLFRLTPYFCFMEDIKINPEDFHDLLKLASEADSNFYHEFYEISPILFCLRMGAIPSLSSYGNIKIAAEIYNSISTFIGSSKYMGADYFLSTGDAVRFGVTRKQITPFFIKGIMRLDQTVCTLGFIYSIISKSSYVNTGNPSFLKEIKKMKKNIPRDCMASLDYFNVVDDCFKAINGPEKDMIQILFKIESSMKRYGNTYHWSTGMLHSFRALLTETLFKINKPSLINFKKIADGYKKSAENEAFKEHWALAGDYFVKAHLFRDAVDAYLNMAEHWEKYSMEVAEIWKGKAEMYRQLVKQKEEVVKKETPINTPDTPARVKSPLEITFPVDQHAWYNNGQEHPDSKAKKKKKKRAKSRTDIDSVHLRRVSSAEVSKIEEKVSTHSEPSTTPTFWGDKVGSSTKGSFSYISTKSASTTVVKTYIPQSVVFRSGVVGANIPEGSRQPATRKIPGDLSDAKNPNLNRSILQFLQQHKTTLDRISYNREDVSQDEGWEAVGYKRTLKPHETILNNYRNPEVYKILDNISIARRNNDINGEVNIYEQLLSNTCKQNIIGIDRIYEEIAWTLLHSLDWLFTSTINLFSLGKNNKNEMELVSGYAEMLILKSLGKLLNLDTLHHQTRPVEIYDRAIKILAMECYACEEHQSFLKHRFRCMFSSMGHVYSLRAMASPTHTEDLKEKARLYYGYKYGPMFSPAHMKATCKNVNSKES